MKKSLELSIFKAKKFFVVEEPHDPRGSETDLYTSALSH